MARTRLNPQLAKLNRNYSVEEVARLYGLNRMTVRRWHKDHGLEAIDDRRPILFTGPVLRAFVAKRRAAAKRPTPPGKLHCFRCRKGHHSAAPDCNADCRCCRLIPAEQAVHTASGPADQSD